MIDMNLRVFLVIISILIFLFVSILVAKNKLLLKYALLWFITSVFLVILSIFPGISNYFSNLFGFEKTSNFIFYSIIGFLTLIAISISVSVTSLNKKMTIIVQNMAINNKK